MSHLVPAFSIAVLVLTSSSLLGESPSQREFDQLKREQTKAVAAAVAPLNARYQASLEQLLKRAMQANDLNTAVKIREELAALGVTSHGSGNTKLRMTAENLPQFLASGEWTWADSPDDAKDNTTHVTFTKDGQFVMGGKAVGPYKILTASTVQIAGGTLKFNDDYSRFEVSNWKGGQARYGQRLK
jgi:hypothetical protein